MQTATPAAETADFGNRLARIEGIIEQLDKRLESSESGQRQGFADVSRRLTTIERRFDWVIGLIFTSWLSIVGLILWKLG